MADENLSIDVTAKDLASKVLDPLIGKVDELESTDPTVDVAADTRKATHSVDGFADQLDRLTDADKVVVLALRAGAAQTELRDLAGDLAVVDAADPDIDVKFARYAEVSGELDHLERQITEISQTSIDPDVSGKAEARLRGIGESAGQAQGAVHSMAGNAIGDFAATATGIGPLGEAIGQLTEQAAGAEGSIREIAVAGAGMAGLAAAIYVVQKAMKAVADTRAFHKGEVDAYAKSVKGGSDAFDDLNTRLRETDKVMGAPSFTNASNWLGLSDAVRDLTKDLYLAGLNVDQYTALVEGSKQAVGDWANAQLAAGVDSGAVLTALTQINAAQDDYRQGTEAAALSASFFNDQQKVIAAEAARWTGLARTYRSDTDDVADGYDAAARAAENSARRQIVALDSLKGEINDQQAFINLEAAFDRVRDTGVKAWDDTKNKTDDAEDSVRAHETATNDLKLAVIDYGTKVLGLPAKQVTDIVTNLNDAGLDEAERRLDALKKQAEIRIKFVQTSGAGFLLGGTTPTPGSVVPSLSAAAAPARWARLNGR